MDDFKSEKIKIDEYGYLWIARAGTMKKQYCPHQAYKCGDWCPRFGNPHMFPPNGQYVLILCEGAKWFVDADCLEDQRGK